ncbi:hypothetical protein B0A49_09329 [Cryomyces minteri]|uniref:SGS-domain-containing protein n=1 Tax=Cryomyces minteri TaxID=331657 RepID=A0A4U0WTX5_9PEZI|nr:hypothetical protein B0A49_09329 [Cryomyces minteri]
MEQAARGEAALKAQYYPEAIKQFTSALAQSPSSPIYYISRSKAYQRLSPPDHEHALVDAENAVIFARQRAKRELIVQAQLRRAIALFGLERYADGNFVLDIVKRMDPKEKTLSIWSKKFSDRLGALPEGDEKRVVHVSEVPDREPPKEAVPNTSTARNDSLAPKTASAPVEKEVVQTPASKIRHEWYQNAENVYFTLFAKGVPKDKAAIEITSTSISISFPLQTSSTYDFSLEPLWGSVDTSMSTYSILSTKIEITLKKASPGQKWPSLESTEPAAKLAVEPSVGMDGSKSEKKINEKTSLDETKTKTAAAPAYPTSSRTGPKDWDKFASDMNDDDEGGDEVNAFFKKLYAGASDDTKRAMMKSYQESNGTALSTNWAEVGSGPVKVHPPDGMVAKKWDE